MSGTRISYSCGEKLTVEDIRKFHDWPKLIRAESPHDCEEPLVALGVKSFQRLSACLFKDSSSNEDNVDYKTDYIIPTALVGNKVKNTPVKVYVLPAKGLDHVFPKMKDLLEYFPRYVKTNKLFVAGDITVKKGKTLELKSRTDDRVLAQIIDGKEVAIPHDAEGHFTVIQDTNWYTLKEVRERFPLPQRVHFKYSVSGLSSQDVLLLAESTHETVITLPLGYLIQDLANEAEKTLNFVYLPTKADDYNPLGDCRFSVWPIGNPGSVTLTEITKKVSEINLESLKDVDTVLSTDASVSSIFTQPIENVYDEIIAKQNEADEEGNAEYAQIEEIGDPPSLPVQVTGKEDAGEEESARMPPEPSGKSKGKRGYFKLLSHSSESSQFYD